MRKLLFLLTVLLLAFSPALGYYDDFTGYDTYYSIIDPCDNVSTAPAVISGAGTDTSNITVDTVQFRDGGKSIRWDKTGATSVTTQVTRSSMASVNMSSLTTGTLQFWYYLPSIVGNWTSGTANISSDTIYAIGGNNTTVATSVPLLTSLATNTWNYFKVSLPSWPVTVDSTAIRSWSVEFISTAAATCTAIRLDDIRVVSANNTTNGLWSEDSGVWSIYNNGGTKVYRQNGNCDIAKPQLLLNRFYKDFVATVDVNVQSANAQYAGLVVNQSVVGSGYYLYNFNAQTRGFELKKYTGSALVDATSTAAATTTTSATNFAYTLKVVSKSGILYCYHSLDGGATWSSLDYSCQETGSIAGRIGFLAGSAAADATVYFTNLVIKPIPYSIVATAGDGRMDISFNSDAKSGEVASYNIYRGTSSKTYGTALTTTASPGFADLSVTNGVTYYYAATANVYTSASTLTETPLSLADEASGAPHSGIKISNNPFTPNGGAAYSKATFSVFNQNNEDVSMLIYKPNGTLVANLNAGNAPVSWNAGALSSTISWDGKNNSGKIVDGGVYVWQIRVGSAVAGKGTVVLAK